VAVAARDDVVLPAALRPLLVVAFVVLYGFPGDTDRRLAWTINPPMSPMTLGAVYLGGPTSSCRRTGPRRGTQ